jgi:HPt (histidine-containing phosphotransfer) domain-containing protein
MFQLEHADEAQELRTALQNNDLELAHRLAHTLKGVAGTIGANKLIGAARQLEAAIKNGETTSFEPYLDQVEYCLAATLQAIPRLELLDRPAKPQLETIDTANTISLAPHLQELARLLKESDVEAVTMLGTLLAQTDQPALLGELKNLEKVIRRYDFESALKSLQIMASKWDIPLLDDRS